jgi:hypothetical protein
MVLENTRTEEQESREDLAWTDCRTQSGGPSRSSVAQAPAPAGGAVQSTGQPGGGLPAEKSDPMAEARSRLERMQFNAVKEELRRAELAFLSAKKLLPDEAGRGAAERIAEALRRCNLSVDSVEKGAAVHHAVETLEGVSKFDPGTRLAEFIQIGGRSLTLSARALASCGVASIEYWGRQLQRLAGIFAGLTTTQVG